MRLTTGPIGRDIQGEIFRIVDMSFQEYPFHALG
jgi:hypothetical protein